MKVRMNLKNAEPVIYKLMVEADKSVDSFKLDPKVKELVKLRTSQINGCGYCVNYHSFEARKLGETERRLYAVNAWWETPFFSEEERAVLKFTEEVTNISHGGVSDNTFEIVLSLLGEQKLTQLLFVISTTNTWNRLAISTHMVAEED
ncbi:MAG TPA: carboxymuconolactone decarboxylase family protein [Ignavibacteriaceae bacterium]|nr:carboxymuconolactone decarboxylase family protein [Ignavibacteriaceae bacterium]